MSNIVKGLIIVAIIAILIIAAGMLILVGIDNGFFNKESEPAVQTFSETTITTVATTETTPATTETVEEITVTEEITETTTQQTEAQTKKIIPKNQTVTTTEATTKASANQTTAKNTTATEPPQGSRPSYTPQDGGFNIGTEGLGNPDATGQVSGLH